MRWLLVLSLASMFALGTIVWADEGRVPLLSLPGPPFIISQPGYYLLTRSIGFTSNTVVQIQTDDVTLDLGGNTISGPTSYVAPTINVQVVSATQGITIKNGRIFAGSHGVIASLSGRPRVRLENLEITGSLAGMEIYAEQADVLDCRVHDLASLSGGGGTAIFVDSFGGRVLDNVVQNVPGDGIHLRGFRGGEIRRNVVRNFGSFVTAGAGIFLEDSSVTGNTGGAVIADNTVSSLPSGVDDAGIRILSPNNLITGNVAFQNGSIGILVQKIENRLERNVASQNHDDGIAIAILGLRAHLEANQSQANLGCGLNLINGVGVIYRDNTLGNNSGGNVCNGPGINAGGNYCDLVLCP